MTQQEIFNILKKLPLFFDLSDLSLLKLVDLIEYKNYRKGKYLYYQGDEANFSYYQIDGLIREEKLCDENLLVIGQFHFDKWYGLEENLLNTNYFHDAYALQDTNVIIISKYNLNIIKEHLELNNFLLKNILKNYQFLENLTDKSTPEKKIIKYLMLHNDKSNSNTISITQEELGNILGYTRETINKYLKKLESLGIISLERGIIIIKMKEELIKFLE